LLTVAVGFRVPVLDTILCQALCFPIGCHSVSSRLLTCCSVIRLVVEFLEEEEEHDSVHADPPDEGSWVVAVDEKQLEGVHHDGNELGHLQRGEILLPPEVLLHAGPERGQQVVRVHDDVHKGVEQAEESAVATWGELDSKPDAHGHAAMVDHMQCGHMLILLP